MDREHTVSRSELVEQLRQLGVARGGVLLVHSAFRQIRPVEGGIEGLIAALRTAIGPEGTLVMPSWTGDDDAVFDPGRTPSADDLGAVPQIFWRLPGVLRADHPQAFAAIGPKAGAILADPLPQPPHIHASPVGRVYDHDGQVLLLGVGHDANTTIHLAECMAGVPYSAAYHVTVMEEGRARRIDYAESDCCCQRFALLDDWLAEAGAIRTGRVGHAEARLMGSRDVVAAALSRLQGDPLVFLHPPEAGCAECDSARASVASG